MITYVGLAGYKQSGKDTVANIIHKNCKHLYPYRVGFADALKEEVANACGVEVSYINEHKDNFRLILQGWGTNFRRELYGDNYWLIKMGMMLFNLSPHHQLVLIPDVRFPNEADFIRELNGEIWNVIRFQDSADKHPSEISLKDYKFDYVIKNTGSMETLELNVIKALEQRHIILCKPQ